MKPRGYEKNENSPGLSSRRAIPGSRAESCNQEESRLQIFGPIFR